MALKFTITVPEDNYKAAAAMGWNSRYDENLTPSDIGLPDEGDITTLPHADDFVCGLPYMKNYTVRFEKEG